MTATNLKGVFLAAILLGSTFTETLPVSCTCNRKGETGAGDGRFVEVKAGRTRGYIVPEDAARAVGHRRVWLPTEKEVLAFEEHLSNLDARVDDYPRQYIGIFVEEGRAMEVKLFCPSMANDYRLDRLVPMVLDGCIRHALYFPESRRLKLEHYFPPDASGSRHH